MDAQFKKKLEYSTIAGLIGIGSMVLASYLFAILSRFPYQAIVEPLWLVGVLAVVVSVLLSIFGFFQAHQEFNEAGSNISLDDISQLPPYLKILILKGKSLQLRLLACLFLLFCLNAPFKWPDDNFTSWISSIETIISIAIMAWLLLKFGQFRKLENQYKQYVPAEFSKTDKAFVLKATFLVIPILFGVIVRFLFLYNYGTTWTLEQGAGNTLVLAGLATVLIELVYAGILLISGKQDADRVEKAV